jgi:hypothetical protein
VADLVKLTEAKRDAEKIYAFQIGVAADMWANISINPFHRPESSTQN